MMHRNNFHRFIRATENVLTLQTCVVHYNLLRQNVYYEKDAANYFNLIIYFFFKNYS